MEGLLAVVSATAGTVVTVTRGSQVITSLLLGASDKIVKPFQNPTLLPIPPHVGKAIQNGKYIDFGDLVLEALLESFNKAQQEGNENTAKPKKKHLKHSSRFLWLQPSQI